MTYLDHAATTPMLPEAVVAMREALSLTGNASSLHSSGRSARRAVEESRESIAAALGARPSEVVLTGGGAEGDRRSRASIGRDGKPIRGAPGSWSRPPSITQYWMPQSGWPNTRALRWSFWPSTSWAG
jgi:selenocysteine lyase/cysteine desulfurase